MKRHQKYNNQTHWLNCDTGEITQTKPDVANRKQIGSKTELHAYRILETLCEEFGLKLLAQIPILLLQNSEFKLRIKYLADFVICQSDKVASVSAALKEGSNPEIYADAQFLVIEVKGQVTPECILKTKLLLHFGVCFPGEFVSIGSQIIKQFPCLGGADLEKDLRILLKSKFKIDA